LAAFGTRPAATSSLKLAPGRKAGTDVFFTLTASPVRGLRAVLAARTRFSKTPNPVIDTFSPLVTAFWISERTASRAAVAVFRSPSRPESASMSSALFTRFPSQAVLVRQAPRASLDSHRCPSNSHSARTVVPPHAVHKYPCGKDYYVVSAGGRRGKCWVATGSDRAVITEPKWTLQAVA